MKSFKKIFLMLTSFAMVVGTLLIGGGIKKTEIVEASSNTYTLVTSASDLKAGSKYIIAANTKNTKPAVAGDIGGNTYMASITDAKFSSDKTKITDSSTAVVLTLGGSENAWTFANSDGKLLGSTAAKKVAWGSGTTTWKITISSSATTISNTTSSCGSLQYNSASPRFTTYSSGQTAVQLYKLDAAYTVTFNANGGSCSTEKLTAVNGIVTLPGANRDNYSFGGWKTADNEFVGNEGKQYTPTGNITLYAIWNDNTFVNAQNELNKINPYMSYGFKYDVSSVKHGQYLLQTDKVSELTDKSLIVVAGHAGKYYALKNVSNDDNKSFGAIEVELDETTNLIKSEYYINYRNLISWNIENVSSEGTFNLSNGSEYMYSTTSTDPKTQLKLSGTGADYKIVSKKYNNNTYYLITIDGNRTVFYNTTTGEYKFYAQSNFGSTVNNQTYCDEMYIYVVGPNVNQNTIDIRSYSNVDIRLKCGIDDTSFANVTLPLGAEYGIAVSTASKTVYYKIASDSTVINEVENPGDAEPNKYVIIKLGNDLLNNFEKVTTEFTTQAYMYVDNMYYLSSNTKTYSVASLTKAAVDSSVEGVSGLYNILGDMGCYNAAQ